MIACRYRITQYHSSLTPKFQFHFHVDFRSCLESAACLSKDSLDFVHMHSKFCSIMRFVLGISISVICLFIVEWLGQRCQAHLGLRAVM